MEIHAPESPVHSLKDFLVHISVVTVGILIALGLEGVREAIHNRHLVRETREDVHIEMEHDQKSATIECAQVARYHRELEALVKTMPGLMRRPDELSRQLNSDFNSQYFFVANSWQTALSTGVFAHMAPSEVSAYAYAAEGIRIYSAMQDRTVTQEVATKALLMSQTHPTPEDTQRATESLLLFAKAQEHLAFFCPQMKDDIDRAYRASAE